jgi:hypothetical protein
MPGTKLSPTPKTQAAQHPSRKTPIAMYDMISIACQQQSTQN